MCQMRIVMQKDARQEPIADAATKLEVTPEGVTLHALFEAPRLIPRATVRSIDFLDGVTVLTETGQG